MRAIAVGGSTRPVRRPHVFGGNVVARGLYSSLGSVETHVSMEKRLTEG